MEFVTENYKEILEIVAYVIAIASVVANITPNESDNAIVAKLRALANGLGLNINVKSIK